MKVFITESPLTNSTHQSSTTATSSSRRKSSYSKESIEEQNFITLIKRISGKYEVETIQKLDLTQNKIHSFPKVQGFQWTSLQSLNLSHNKIRNMEGLHLDSLPQLERLDLSYNKIQVIPKDFIQNGHSRLHTIAFEGNNDLEDVECIRNLSVVSNTLIRLSFQKHEGKDACPLCQKNINRNKSLEANANLYYEIIFASCPKLKFLDGGSVKVLKSYLESRMGKSNDGISPSVNESVNVDGALENGVDSGNNNNSPCNLDRSLFHDLHSINFHEIATNNDQLTTSMSRAREAIEKAKSSLGS
jgi:Leucine-rich repeat (LRR) protein